MNHQTFTKPTFTENVILEKKDGFFIYDFSALDVDGNPVWYLLAVPKANTQRFMDSVNQENTEVDIKQYGKILASGPGSEAPDEIRQEIIEKYKFILD